MIKSFMIAGLAGEGVVALVDDDKTVLLQPLLEMFDDVTAEALVFDDSFVELVWGGFELRLEHDQELRIATR